MAILRDLALFLLCLVGYSAAVVATAPGTHPRPGGWEVLAAGLSGIAAATAGPGLAGHWMAFPVAAAIGAAPGALAGLLRRSKSRPAHPDRGSTPIPRQPEEGSSDLDGVRGFLLRLGDFQGRLTLGYLYYLLLAPFAAVSRLHTDPLSPDTPGDSYWSERESCPTGEEDQPLTRQY